MSRISVIVPTLNEQRLLPGMLRQFTPAVVEKHSLEIIVSDGGSMDGTLGVARLLAHRVIENSQGNRQTIANGRNIGCRHSSGEILVFLNADTLVSNLDGFLSRVVDVLRDPQTCALTCCVEVYPHERTLADSLFHGFYNRFFHAMNTVGMAMGRGECHIIRRKAFEEVGGYSDAIAAGEDYDMFRRLAKVGRVRFLRELLVFESPRRYRHYGYIYVTASWFLNFLAVFFLGRSLLREWKPIR